MRLSFGSAHIGQHVAILGYGIRVDRDWLPIDADRQRETAIAYLRDPAALESRWLTVGTDDGIVAAIEVGLALCPS